MLGVPGMLGILGVLMKINSDIQEIVNKKVDKCADDVEAATQHAQSARHALDARYAYDFWCNGYALNALNAWSHYENQF